MTKKMIKKSLRALRREGTMTARQQKKMAKQRRREAKEQQVEVAAAAVRVVATIEKGQVSFNKLSASVALASMAAREFGAAVIIPSPELLEYHDRQQKEEQRKLEEEVGIVSTSSMREALRRTDFTQTEMRILAREQDEQRLKDKEGRYRAAYSGREDKS